MKDYNGQSQSDLRLHYTQQNAIELLSYALKEKIKHETIIICVGTDRCIGDSLGPMVGTMLQNKNFRLPLYGTLEDPIHAINIEKKVKAIKAKHPNAFIIVIDACLGDKNLIGNIHIKKGPLFPGKGVGKDLPGIGDISIIGIVDNINNEDHFSIHTIRLSLIFRMAEIISDALILATYLC